MQWEAFYDKLGIWATGTLVNRMSKLESFGPPDEVAEVIIDIAFDNEKGATRLLKRATAAGVKFTGEQLAQFCGCCDDEAIQSAIQLSGDQFTTMDLENLRDCFDEDLLVDIAMRYQIKLPECLADYAIVEYGCRSPVNLATAYHDILEYLCAARSALEEAHTCSILDISRTRREWTVLKYTLVEEAQHSISCAIAEWELLDFPGKDQALFPKVFPCMHTSDMWLNYWGKGFWAEAIAERRIKKLIITVDQAISAIRMLRNEIL